MRAISTAVHRRGTAAESHAADGAEGDLKGKARKKAKAEEKKAWLSRGRRRRGWKKAREVEAAKAEAAAKAAEAAAALAGRGAEQ
jgi:hypothetical protein